MDAAGASRFFKGTAFTSEGPQTVRTLKDALFEVDCSGVIASVLEPGDPRYQPALEAARASGRLTELDSDSFLLPGFVDLHLHAPQWAQAGAALDIPLYDWLHTYTFPLESRFSDPAFALPVYEHLVDTLLANGTTTAVYFATVHPQTSYLLAEICARKGQRAFVGKVVMDNPDQTSPYYRDESTQSALDATEAFLERVASLGGTTVQGIYPVVTPRFIPSCTDEALRGLGRIADRHGAYIQSHCSESDWEHEYVRSRFGMNDAFALDSFGLLTRKTLLAHCVFLADADAELFRERGATICHSPLSNVFFSNGILPLKRFLDSGVSVGLATDISGGYSPSLYQNIRQAFISSRTLEEGTNPALPAETRGIPGARLTLNEAFYLATAGGGKALDLPIGKLETGFAFDAQVLCPRSGPEPLPFFGEPASLEDSFHRTLLLAEPSHIRTVYVQGRKVRGA